MSFTVIRSARVFALGITETGYIVNMTCNESPAPSYGELKALRDAIIKTLDFQSEEVVDEYRSIKLDS